MGQQHVTEHAHGVYERINALWKARRQELFGGACGFSILSGPPMHSPALMIVGANPGFGMSDNEPHVELSWPPASYVGDADWTLARKLRAIFAEAGRSEALMKALQTNFLFFKSSSLGSEGRYPWLRVPAWLRADLEGRCREEVIELIRRVEPGLVFVLGLAPFDRHASAATTVLMDRTGKRRLLVAGLIGGRAAVGILHPSGARVAATDWSRVSDYLAERMPAEAAS